MLREKLGWPVTFLLLLLNPGVSPAGSDFEAIFDGRSLEGWAGDRRFWGVEDGAIVGRTTPETPAESNTFLIWEGGQVQDFELLFQFRIDSEWANSGIQVRSVRLEDDAVAGYQPDLATEDWITGILYEEKGRGILARRGERVVLNPDGSRHVSRFAEEEALGRHIRGRGQWNDYHVVARGPTLITHINGERMHEVTDQAPEARRRGILAFQIHRGPPMTIRFQDIRLRHLLPEDSNQ